MKIWVLVRAELGTGKELCWLRGIYSSSFWVWNLWLSGHSRVLVRRVARSHLLLCYCINILNKSNLWSYVCVGGAVIWFKNYNLSQNDAKARAQGRHLKARPKVETMEKCCLQICSLWLAHSAFLCYPEPSAWKWALPATHLPCQ